MFEPMRDLYPEMFEDRPVRHSDEEDFDDEVEEELRRCHGG